MKLALSEANVTRPAAQTLALISVLVLILTLAYGSTPVKGNPAPEWVNFFSSNTTFLGQPVPVGAVVAAFDPQGVKCGQRTVEFEGKYGVLSCYRDDDTTPEDDGADPEDVISFTINGLPAAALGPDEPIWTSHGDLRLDILQCIRVSLRLKGPSCLVASLPHFPGATRMVFS